jgi:sialic acid synthase SpsE
MSEELNGALEEAMELVEEAQSKKVFNLSDAIKGRAYPQKSVTIYLDDESALKLVELNDKMSYVTDVKELAKLEAEAASLEKNIQESALTFKMRGVNQDAIELVLKQMNEKYKVKGSAGTDNPDWMRDYITNLISLNIVSVTDASGSEDETVFTFEKADEVRKNIPAAEWGKLVEMMQKLTLAGGYFEQLTDAGFLQKS